MASVEKGGEVGLAADGPTLRGGARMLDLTIGQVSQRTGIPAKTIRYYESVGLLPRPARSENHYRRYSHADVNRLLLLRRIKLLGAPLVEAKQLLASATDARCADAQEALLTLVDERLVALDQQIVELLALRTEIHDYRRMLESCQTDETTAFSECGDMRCIGALPEGDNHDEENRSEDGCTHELLRGSGLLPLPRVRQ
ncbi:MAG TPA: MerR family transcriptional regulator [Ktedonobacterales bacterium]|nr:MerR family transcriptional regulator [Ktedonobacterales bacterium]